MKYRKKFEGVIVSAKAGYVIKPEDLPIHVHSRFDDSRMKEKLTDENGRVEILGVPYGAGDVLEAVDFERFEAMRSEVVKDLTADILEGNTHPEIGIEVRKGGKGRWPAISWTEEDVLRLYSAEIADGTARLLPCPDCGGTATIGAMMTDDGVYFTAGCDGCHIHSSDCARVNAAVWEWNGIAEGGGSRSVDGRQETVNPTAGTTIRQGTFEWVLSRIKFGPDISWSMFRRKAWSEGVHMGSSGGHPAVFFPMHDRDGRSGVGSNGYVPKPLTSEDVLAEDWTRIPQEGGWEWSFPDFTGDGS